MSKYDIYIKEAFNKLHNGLFNLFLEDLLRIMHRASFPWQVDTVISRLHEYLKDYKSTVKIQKNKIIITMEKRI